MGKMIDINCVTKDRVSEIALLLQSLRTQDYQDFDVYILDDASGTPLTNFHFFNSLVQRLKFEGHRVHIIVNSVSLGAARSRQKLVDYTLLHGRGDSICRLDDDVILESSFLSDLVLGFKAGYDIVSGVTPVMARPDTPRENRFVRPIINRVVLSDDGSFLFNGDDCGHTFSQDEILPAHHFRSNALIKNEVHEKVSYEDTLCRHSFREEQFFSFRAILAGFKIGVNTGAKCYHFTAPSGGERSHEGIKEQSLLNQKLLNRFVKRKVKEEGKFIDEKDDEEWVELYGEKDTNLIFSREE